jgi:hypothetical protein
MSLLSDVATYLDQQGYGKYANVVPALNSIFLDEYQDTPDNQIVVLSSGGREPSAVMGGSSVDYPYFDIQVRNTSKATARTNAEVTRRLLDGYTTVNGCTVWDMISAPVYIGKDDSNRYKFALTFRCIVERI